MSDNKNSVYTATLDNLQTEKLLNILKEKEWKIEPAQSARWKASAKGINVIAYASGKLVVQGKETKDFVLFLLEPEILLKASLGYENLSSAPDEKFAPHIGIDESGKGDFFGPLVIAAVFVDDKSRSILAKIGTRDSKLIKNDKAITKMAAEIKAAARGDFAIVTIGPESYNRLYAKIRNLNKMLAWGHSRALENLLDKEVKCEFAISDQFGDKRLIENALLGKGKKIKLIQRTKAESDIAVAAASILARAEFVRRLELMGKEINCELPKGASDRVVKTAANIIKRHGPEKLSTLAKTHFKTLAQAQEESEKLF